ncbi:hypothetical protein SCLCIDRAFT_956428 [Scleroderma citrinum Foug A]|uniref:Uncharacterized protein n=1 Tax=Scleroderma citrinum Foug A TaxID=1036808 RepID=A0A0C3EJU4_9AGAM|nr:hypothetical protein SCLCIDRAFT_956428 [Scleroderma citrinum Foug A]
MDEIIATTIVLPEWLLFEGCSRLVALSVPHGDRQEWFCFWVCSREERTGRSVGKRQCRRASRGSDRYLCAVCPTSIYPVTLDFILPIRTLSSLPYTYYSAMISPPLSPKMARKLPGNDMENENQMSPPLSPKRSFAQDHLDPIDSKRRHVLLDGEVRTPLDPLPLADMENMASGDPQWFDANIHFSLSPSPSLPDLRSTSFQRKSRGQPCSATGNSTAGPVCSWPPSASHRGSVALDCKPKRHGSENDILLSPDARGSFRAAMSRSSSSLPLSENSQPPAMPDNSQRALQPIRTCSNSLPLVRCPPDDQWQAGIPAVDEPAIASEPGRTDYGTVDTSPPLFPPGLSLYPPGLRRSGSDTDLLAPGSASSFLASGSQLIRASGQANSVPPIGAERSRVLRMIASRPIKDSSEPPPTDNTTITDPPAYFWYPPLLSPKLQSKLQNIVHCWSERSTDIPPCEPRYDTPTISRDDFHRLLRQTTNNKFASRIISPLSPLRSPAPSFTLTTNPAYQARVPSLMNTLSLRYSKRPMTRSRTICDTYQPLHVEEACTHCQECKRDSIGKRLMAFKYRQQSQYKFRMSERSFGHPFPACTTQDMLGEDRCDERSLWDEVASSASAEPFSRHGSAIVVGSNNRCAVGNSAPSSPRLQDIHAFEDVDFPQIPNDDILFTNVSVTCFREVTVY